MEYSQAEKELLIRLAEIAAVQMTWYATVKSEGDKKQLLAEIERMRPTLNEVVSLSYFLLASTAHPAIRQQAIAAQFQTPAGGSPPESSAPNSFPFPKPPA